MSYKSWAMSSNGPKLLVERRRFDLCKRYHTRLLHYRIPWTQNLFLCRYGVKDANEEPSMYEYGTKITLFASSW
jgi:hypothetical protein